VKESMSIDCIYMLFVGESVDDSVLILRLPLPT
jgi:hypothetical protein